MSPNPIANALNRLRDHIALVPAQLAVLPVSELTRNEAGKWSRQEILGHLIDSAINNLKRFTDAQFANGPYQLIGYNQNQLVVANRYQNLPLAHLLTLWSSLNTQILYVSEAMSAEILARPVWFAQAGVPDQPLAWLINDYVAHLEHHLNTLLSGGQDPAPFISPH